jgi:hypothetical protein
MSEELQVNRWTRAETKQLREVPFDRDVLRALVDYRFSAQGRRKATGNQIGAIERATDTSHDLFALRALNADFDLVENKANDFIKAMVEQHPAGLWAVSIPGIAHKFAGFLLAYVDLHPWRCMGHTRDCGPDEPCSPDCHSGYTNTASKVWRFFGVDPTIKWEKGNKRPYCALGKSVVWQIGESFKKIASHKECPKHGKVKRADTSGDDKSVRCEICARALVRVENNDVLYCRLYNARKALEVQRNDAGEFREQALARLEAAKKNKWKISPAQRDLWASGKLQPIGLDYRAGRYAAKIFLSHFHHVLHEVELGTAPPVPYILGPGKHADFIPVPNWPMR